MARKIPSGWRELETKEFLKFTPRPIDKPKRSYRSLGIRSHCKGTFVREVENPDKVMMETLYAVKKNDLIVNITFAWEGAVALVKESDEGALVSHRFPTYVFDHNVAIPEFIRFLIPSKRFVYDLGVISPGGAGRNRVLDRNDFLHLKFVLPPVSEQKKIVKILSTWDRAIETLDRLIKGKTRLREKFAYDLLTKRSTIEDSSWRGTTLGAVSQCVSGGTPSRNVSKYYDGEIPWIKSGEVLNSEIIDAEEKITKAGLKNSAAKIIPAGSTLVAMYGANAGNVGRLRIEATTNQAVLALVPKDDVIEADYLYYVTSAISNNLIRKVQGSGQPNLSGSLIKQHCIYLPDFKVQRRITQALNYFEREIGILIRNYKLFTIQKQSLMQKLLTGKIRVASGNGKDGA